MGISIAGGVSLPGSLSFYIPPPPPAGKELWAWGYNSAALPFVGDGTVIARSSPVQIGALTDWASASTGSGNRTVLAIKTDGTLWTWGSNRKGQIGDGTAGGGTYKSSPVQIGALTDWSKGTGGEDFSVALKTNGELWAWGYGFAGALGNGSSIDRSSPIQIGALTDWSSVFSGSFFTHAIKIDGTLWGWGRNEVSGTLGDGTKTNRDSPVQIGVLTTWTSVGNGSYHGGAIKTDGTLWTWGRNNQGGLGHDDLILRSSPVQVGSLTDWSIVSGGFDFTMAIKTDGTLWGWGQSTQGQLGDSTIIQRSSPVQVGSLTDWTAVSAAGNFTVARKTDGSIWSWGSGGAGRTGQGDTIARSSPVQIGTLTTWTSITVGGFHGNALK